MVNRFYRASKSRVQTTRLEHKFPPSSPDRHEGQIWSTGKAWTLGTDEAAEADELVEQLNDLPG